MKKFLIGALLLASTSVFAQSYEMKMATDVIKMNKGYLQSIGLTCKVAKTEKVREFADLLDVKATCSNGDVYRVLELRGGKHNVKTLVHCGFEKLNGGDGQFHRYNITVANCKNTSK